MSWPDCNVCMGSSENVSSLIEQACTPGRAIQSCMLTGNTTTSAALEFLSVYKQPVGEDRLEVSRIANRNRKDWKCVRDVEAILYDPEWPSDMFSKPGTAFDSDSKMDPAQLVDWKEKKTFFDLAREITAGINTPTQQLCACFDWVKNNIAYEKNITQFGVANYWASAAETVCMKRGDCVCQSLVFLALAEALGFLTRLVSIPGHSFAQVLVDPAHFEPQEIFDWNKMHKSTKFGGARSTAAGVNWFIADGRWWLLADLTMTNYLGSRADANFVDVEDVNFNFKPEWMQKAGGKSVTYRYASDRGTLFEWGCDSLVDGTYDSWKGVTFYEGEPVPGKDELTETKQPVAKKAGTAIEVVDTLTGTIQCSTDAAAYNLHSFSVYLRLTSEFQPDGNAILSVHGHACLSPDPSSTTPLEGKFADHGSERSIDFSLTTAQSVKYAFSFKASTSSSSNAVGSFSASTQSTQGVAKGHAEFSVNAKLFHPVQTVWTIVTHNEARTSSTTYSLEVELCDDKDRSVKGNALNIKGKSVPIKGHWSVCGVEWVEQHVWAGTYANDYKYTVAANAEEGAYVSNDGRYKGTFVVKH